MSSPAFFKNYFQTLSAAELCLSKDLHMPALILVFTAMDSFAWAASAKGERKTKAQFEEWVDKWVLPNSALECSSTELYAARCGVLHTLTSKADLNQKAGVRQVVYAWGPAQASTLQQSIKVINQPQFVGVHINQLLTAVKEGMAKTLDAADTDATLAARLAEAASFHFIEMPRETLERLLVLHANDRTLP